jgi:hypothetical protein
MARHLIAMTNSHMARHLIAITRFINYPQEDHWAAVKHLLCYVKGTIDQGVTFPKTGGARLQLRCFSDADMAGHVDGWKGTSGMLAFLGSSPVAWQSQKQKVVALSPCEVEY